ncbi:4-alpha-glucanotransferase, partial [Salmonella enterica subsp. enterica serovar Typhi]
FGQDPEVVDYAGLFEKRRPVLEKAVKNFLKEERATRMLSDFLQEEKWVTDFAEFMAIKEHFGNKALQEWDDKAIIRREEEALAGYRQKLSEVIKYHEVTQYFFYKQWFELKEYANDKGIQIIGDMPIYVSADSVE